MRALLRTSGILALVATAQIAQGQAAPKSGVDVLQRMHDAYAGKWYSTLTFVQKTTQWRPDNSEVVSTWYEAVRYTPTAGTQLRIDLKAPTSGDGMLYTADSGWVIRGGKVVTVREGNEFLPLIEGVYMQPVERTARELKPTKVDMQRVTSGKWRDRAVWIVGASSASDTTSPQFWIDAQRNVVVRMILAPDPNTVMDIRLDNYVPLAGGWLGTRIEIYVGGARRQFEEYSD